MWACSPSAGSAVSRDDGPGSPGRGRSTEDLLGATGYAGVLKDAWYLYRTNWLALLRLFLGGMIVLFLAEFAWLFVYANIDTTALVQVAVSILIGTLLPAVLGSLLVAVAHIYIVDRLVGRPTTLLEAARLLRADTPSLLQCLLVAGTGAMFFGILGGAILSLAWWGPPILGSAVVVERRPFPDAWAATRERLKGNVGRVLLVTLLVSLVVVVANFLVVPPLDLALRGMGFAGNLIAYVIAGVFAAVLRPLLAATTLRLYFDVRARSDESFDEGFLRAERERGPSDES